jgi:uncharacterized protein (DUF1499 family)
VTRTHRGWRTLLLACVLTASASAAQPTLAPCPSSPNCVSSLATDPTHQMAPWPAPMSASVALDRLAAIVTAEPRTAVVSRDTLRLRVTFTSRLFRFVDDVEFAIDPVAQLVHFRSASRVGYGDLGVNRARMGRLRTAFLARDST